MNGKILSLTYESSLADLCSVNSSFDTGILRIAYTGANKNNSFISKEVFERCLNTIFNCPIVCNYDRETDTLGGHDVEIVQSRSGGLSLVNLTVPVGCVPESSRVFWETVEEADGSVHEYLCADVLLWKRQEAYSKIKRDGIVAHSMEITVKDGETKDGLYYINDFEFTAFALIGVAPCFESASLEVFSQQSFKEQFAEMMLELKESYQTVNASHNEDDNTQFQKHDTEGGKQELNESNVTTNTTPVREVEAQSSDEAKFSDSAASDAGQAATAAGGAEDSDKFALLSNLTNEVSDALSQVKYRNEYGDDYARYLYVDLDTDANTVYCWDVTDWLLYGFTYTVNGDAVTIDFDSKKRKKYVIEDYDEGENPTALDAVFAQHMHSAAKWEDECHKASATIVAMETELNELREFKNNADNAAEQAKRDTVLAQFGDLEGLDAFEELKDNCAKYDVDVLEEKCFALRGRQGVSAKFSLGEKAPKLKVGTEDKHSAPYGGLFEKYGFSAEN